MHITDLCGSWTLASLQQDLTLPATVPGCAHTDLLAAGKLPDPWWRDNEKELHWVFLEDWRYHRTFDLGPEAAAHSRLVLRCEGLDTLATVKIDGKVVLEADNMFRTWEVDLTGKLSAGRHEIEIDFPSPLPWMNARQAECPIPGWNIYHKDFFGRSYLRKMGCAFGWDWGLMAPTAGIWKPIQVLAFDARITGVRCTQEHAGGNATLRLATETDGQASSVRHTLSLRGDTVASLAGKPGVSLSLAVPNPELWWTNGMGPQTLYTLRTEILGAQGQVLDMQERRIGLRSCELVRQPDTFGESFRFRVNGRDIFAKGSNWIPADIWPSRVSDANVRDLLESAAAAHQNMIRVWGGGFYESDAFYDLCDELGILVWQDFMFSCATYPVRHPGFLDNVEAEARDNIRRLRHRPCMALWCGNNELEQGLVGDKWNDRQMSWEDYSALFDVLLARVVAEEDGVTPYWPCSPHTPGKNRLNFNDETIGDAHAWSVWFGGETFEAQRSWNYRFMSEFGFQSFPELRTLESCTLPEDRNLTSWIMDVHQRSEGGNARILKYQLDWFQQAKDLESTLWLTQLTQALCIHYAAEHARRIQGRMDGLMYWQLNDLWPGATWSSIDVFGRWKALHYLCKRFFEPVHLSLLEHQDGRVEIHVSNHRPESVRVTVKWRAVTTAGACLAEGVTYGLIASQHNENLATLDATPWRVRGGTAPLPIIVHQHRDYRPIDGDRDLILLATAEIDGVEVSRNLATFARPRHMLLSKPVLSASVQAIGGGAFEIRLASDRPAPWTRVELKNTDARYSDNFLHLDASLPATITVVPAEALDLAEVEARLRLVSLVEHWQ